LFLLTYFYPSTLKYPESYGRKFTWIFHELVIWIRLINSNNWSKIVPHYHIAKFSV
jgi:hypothetical protein